MTEFVWTEENMAYLQEHYANGETASELAVFFGVTRNAVCGKLARLHIYRPRNPLQGPRAVRQRPKPSKPVTKPVAKPVRAITLPAIAPFRAASTYTRGYRPRREPKVDIAPPPTEHAPLMARTGCAFPVNDGAPFLFCNAALDLPVSAYCAHHRQRMFAGKEKAA